MKIYKISFTLREDGEHTGYGYYSSKRKAQATIRGYYRHTACELEVIIVLPTKAGIIKALNRHGSHADNG